MIAIMGGTFDPIHFGHLRPALEIVEQLQVDEMRLIPSATPPHRSQPKASTKHRLTMVKEAVRGVNAFVVDDRECQREGASYTVDTLKSLRAEIGEKEPLCLLLGMDALYSFTQWKDWKEILKLAHLVVSKRPGYEKKLNEPWIEKRLVYSPKDLREMSAGSIYFTRVTQLKISATMLRKQIGGKKSVQYLTPDSVCSYIQEQNLYLEN